jgi:hypothetical protein
MFNAEQIGKIVFNNLQLVEDAAKRTLMTAKVSLSSALFNRLRTSRSRPRCAPASANGALRRAGGGEINDVKENAPVVGRT